jgi:hypothetical protein
MSQLATTAPGVAGRIGAATTRPRFGALALWAGVKSTRSVDLPAMSWSTALGGA